MDGEQEYSSDYVRRWDQAFICGAQNILLMFGFLQKKLIHLHPVEKKIPIVQLLSCPALFMPRVVVKIFEWLSEYHVWITLKPKCIICTEHSAAATINLFTIQSKHLPT